MLNKYFNYYNFEKYMSLASSDFKELSDCAVMTIRINKKKKETEDIINNVNKISFWMFVVGAIMFALHFNTVQNLLTLPEKIRVFLVAYLSDFTWPAVFMISSIVYRIGVTQYLKFEIKKDEKKIHEFSARKEELNKKIYKHYLGYRNPPVSFQYSHPEVINEVTKLMENKNVSFEVAYNMYAKTTRIAH